MRKLRTTALAIAAVAAIALTGCTAPSGSNSGPIQLNYWSEDDSGPPLATDKALVAEFNKTHPDIQVKFRSISNASFFTVMRNAFTAGNAPEIFQHEGNNNLFQFVTEGQVVDISDWFNKKGIGDRFSPGSAGSVTYDGKIYGIPEFITTTDTIFYNKAILSKYSIDPSAFTSWADFLSAFGTLKAAGVTPIAYGNSEGWPGSQWFYQFLAKYVGATKVNQLVARNCGYKWTDQDIVAAAQLYVDLSKEGYFTAGQASDDWNTAEAAFVAGRAPFFATGAWLIPQLLGAPNASDFAVAKFPAVSGGTTGSATNSLIDVTGLAMSKSADTPAKVAAAETFFDWITQVPQQEKYVQIGDVSTALGANEVADPMTKQVVSQSIDNSTGSFPFLEHILPKAVGEDAIWNGSVAVLTGQATALSWMQNVEKAAVADAPTVKIPDNCTP